MYKIIYKILTHKYSFKLYILFFAIKIISYLKKLKLKKMIMSVPFLRKKVLKNLIKNSRDLHNDMITSYQNYEKIPEKNLLLSKVEMKMNSMKKTKNNNKVSGIIYLGNDLHNENMLKIFKKCSYSNPLHPDLFPAIREMEIDIINMVKDLYKGDDNCCGNITYGGTESILLCCVTYRDYYKDKYNIDNPNMVCFNSVHPAFDKACHYFNIKMIKVSNLKEMNNNINKNTIMIVASCPEYSHGLIDPISDMNKMALERNVSFHVDCCMGGFLIPFIKNYKYINFSLRGISSFSIDTHKYGYSLKGSSVLLFKNREIKKYQHFIRKDWCGGVYATPTLMGSKSGGLIASTWSCLLMIGKKNYINYSSTIRKNLLKIKDKFKLNKDISVIGNPDLNIIAFKSKSLNIYSVIGEMKKLNWNLTVMQNPPAFHLCITKQHTFKIINDFCSDLLNCIDIVKKNKSNKLEGTLALYGSSTSVQNSLFIDEIIHDFLFLLSSNDCLSRYNI